MEQVVKTIGTAIGDWIVNNVGWTVLIVLFLLSCFFKIAKKEIDPLGWVIGLIGKPLTKDVRKGIEKMQTSMNKKIDELKADSNKQIADLRTDLDDFEKTTNQSIQEIQVGTGNSCKILKKELDAIKKSNDMQTIRQIRAHVLDFANSCMNGRPHTKKEFDNIMRENEQYEALVKKHKVRNAVYKEDFAFIKKKRDECRENNSFLKGLDIDETDVDPEESEN